MSPEQLQSFLALALGFAFAGLLVTSIMGIGMYLVAEVIERRMTGWATRGVDGGMMASQG